jgi:membrane protein implicated in regulation of membrane protease activity
MFESFWTFLIAWYNLPFTLMLGLGVTLAGLQLFGLSHEGDTDAEAHVDVDGHIDADGDMDMAIHHDLDHDLDHDFGHDIDHDVDHDIDHDVDHDLDHAADHDMSRDSFSPFSWLAFIGIGKAPLMVVLLIVLMTTGLLGWFLNGLAVGMLGFFPGLLLLGTFLVSLLAGSLVTSRVTRFIGRALPPVSTTATRAQALVGRPGTVISPFIDGRYGMVHLRDDGGTLISLFAITDDEQPIARGESVILLSYDALQRRYLVTRR